MTTRKDARVSSDYLREALDALTNEVRELRGEVRVLSRLVATAEPQPVTPIKFRDDGSADLLYGVPAIAAYLGTSKAVGYHLHANSTLPTFKVGAKVCARRSDLDQWLAAGRTGGVK